MAHGSKYIKPIAKPEPLDADKRKFVACFTGNAARAIIDAGITKNRNSAKTMGRQFLLDPAVAKALKEREVEEVRPYVATRIQRQEFWTRTMDDVAAEMKDRLRASELLAKSEGDFVERMEISAKFTLENLVMQSLDPTPPGTPVTEIVVERLEESTEDDMALPEEGDIIE